MVGGFSGNRAEIAALLWQIDIAGRMMHATVLRLGGPR